jgi:hypothetical protein
LSYQGAIGGDESKAPARNVAIGNENRTGKAKLLVAEGESVPGPILEIGNFKTEGLFCYGGFKICHAIKLFG